MGNTLYFVIAFVISVFAYSAIMSSNKKSLDDFEDEPADILMFVTKSFVIGLLWPIAMFCVGIYVAGNWGYKMIQRRIDKGE